MTPDLRRGDVQPLFKQPKKAAPKWGKPVKPVSDKKAAAKPWRDRIRERVFDRDGYGCWLAGETPWNCHGVPTVHHRRKASDQGAWSMENLITLCSTHNGLIEDEAGWFRERFPWLVVRRGDAEWESLGQRRRRAASNGDPTAPAGGGDDG